MRKTGRFYSVGVGPGDPELITLKAARILSSVPTVFVPKKGEESASYARSIIADLVTEGQEVVELVFPMVRDQEQLANHWRQACDRIWQRLEAGQDCAFVNLGDPQLYGTSIHVLETLRREHPDLEVQVVPGVSSINAAAANALVPLATGDERMAVVSGKWDDNFIRETLRNFETVVFMKMHQTFDGLFGILEELDLVKNCVYVEKCSTPDEKVITNVRKLEGKKLDYFSLLIVRR